MLHQIEGLAHPDLVGHRLQHAASSSDDFASSMRRWKLANVRVLTLS